MLAPAHAGHLEFIRTIIRRGAIEGSFDPELALNSRETHLFFANLRQSLVGGRFVEVARDGTPTAVPAPGYVYWPAAGDREHPIGFGLFKSLGDLGYELWLTGVESESRGRGHGRAMLSALLATPAGQFAHVVRVKRGGTGSDAMQHLLESLGFAATRDTTSTRWFVRAGAPAEVATRIRDATLVEVPSR